MNWKDPNRVLLVQDCADPSDAKVFRAHAPSQGACENLVCALKVFGESAYRVRQLCGYALRGFIEDNHEAIKIEDLEKNSEAIKVGPNFDRNVPRCGPGRRGRIDTSNM